MWILATLIAALAQTGRNAAQAGLSGQVGTVGATAVRFFFGLPFAALFLLVMSAWQPLPAISGPTLGWAGSCGSATVPTRATPR